MFDIDALQDLIAPDVFFLLAAWGLSMQCLVANVSRLQELPASAEAQRGTLQWLGWVGFGEASPVMFLGY